MANLAQVYLTTLEKSRDVAMRYRKDERWHDISLKEFGEQVRHLSMALVALGVRHGDRVAILSENRPEWTITDLAILCSGGATVPIYATLTDHQIEYVLRDSASTVLVVSDAEQMEKVRAIRDGLPSLRKVILVDGHPDPGDLGWRDLLDTGREIENESGREEFDKRIDSIKTDDLATIVYTSGTTGDPKGAMLSHGNIASNMLATSKLIEAYPGEVALCILPLTHILERMADFTFLYKGVTIAYNDDLTRTGDNLQEVAPHVFAAVPRLFEKMQAKILDNVAAKGGVAVKLFDWAIGVAKQRLPYAVKHETPPFFLNLKSKLAHALVFKKIHDRLGGRVRLCISGGAPLSAELAAFFIGAGIEIYEGYGLTETSPVISLNTPGGRKLGTVGRPIEGVEVKIAPDGEILSRGPHIMLGYWNKPEATDAVIDDEGWFHTGDIGEIDEEGFLRITDRKKDIIVTAYGKNIAPQPLEGQLKTSPWIATPVIIGDRRKYLVALIVPNLERLEKEAAERGEPVDDGEDLIRRDWVREIMDGEIERYNAGIDRQEKIRRYALLPRDLTIEDDEITPSMKVKRRVVERKFASLIDSMYEDERASDTHED